MDEAGAADVELRVLLDEYATTSAVLNTLPPSTIVHFACHGTQNVTDPLLSGLHLHNGLLKLSELMTIHLPKARLAFLSACETAMGDQDQPDEAMHLAAGMLAAGFKSVIGTMWAIPDDVAPVVAEKVYQKLFKGQSGTVTIGIGKTAEALHSAIQDLRNEGYGFMAWMPFIHLGA